MVIVAEVVALVVAEEAVVALVVAEVAAAVVLVSEAQVAARRWRWQQRRW